MVRYFTSLFVSLILLLLFGVTNSFAATYTVTKTADTNDGTCDADCSLREAVAAANSNSGNDEIDFAIPSSDGGYVAASGSTQAYWLITTTSTITLSDDSGVFINGYSQSGSSRNTATFGNEINTILTIQIFTNTTSVNINITGDNNHIAGLNIRTLNVGLSSVDINTSSNNWIEGNFFGSDITGTLASNGGMSRMLNSSASNIIGTNGDGSGDTGERNLFAGTHTTNAVGGYVDITSGDSNIVAGNYMGTDKTGRACTVKTLSFSPLQISTANNRIGTNYDGVSDSEEANIIGCTTNNASSRAYIRVLNPSSGNLIQGNYIGISPQGNMLGELYGTAVSAVALSGLTGNVIKGNTISNAKYGIGVVASSVLYNTFRQNIIYGNATKSILLSGSTPYPNDAGDADTGGNDLMNYPIIDSVDYLGGKNFKVHGNLDGNSSEAPYIIEVCRSSDDSSGNGGCLESLGTMSLSSPGNWEINVYVSGYSEYSQITFTSLATNTSGSTSEFGNNYDWYVHSSPETSPSYVFGAAPATVITSVNDIVSMAISNVFNYNAYLSVEETPKTSTYKLPGSSYWQVGPRKEIWWKSDFNDAKILASEVNRPFTLLLKYNESDLGPNLPEKNLRLAYSANNGKTWKVLTNYILDTKNNSIAIVTKQGGLFMFVSGYPKYNQTSVRGISTTIDDNKPTLSHQPTPTSPPPNKEKRCIWFICW